MNLFYLRVFRILRRTLVIACLSGLSFGGQYEIREQELIEENKQEQRFIQGF